MWTRSLLLVVVRCWQSTEKNKKPFFLFFFFRNSWKNKQFRTVTFVPMPHWKVATAMIFVRSECDSILVFIEETKRHIFVSMCFPLFVGVELFDFHFACDCWTNCLFINHFRVFLCDNRQNSLTGCWKMKRTPSNSSSKSYRKKERASQLATLIHVVKSFIDVLSDWRFVEFVDNILGFSSFANVNVPFVFFFFFWQDT